MKNRLLRGLRNSVTVATLWMSMTSGWAQTDSIRSRIETLEPTQQRQLQAMMALRNEQDGPQLFTDEEVRTIRAKVPESTTPLPTGDVEKLSQHIKRIYGIRGVSTDRIVNTDPVFPVCPSCSDGLGKTCHDSPSKYRRATASNLLTQYRYLAEAVGGLYLVEPDGASQLIGTVFVLQGYIVTNVHVVLDATQPAGAPDLRKIKPGIRLEAAFGADGVRRIILPESAPWRRHPNLDLILTKWPVGVAEPTGLNLRAEQLPINTPVALLGFPSVNTNTDRTEDIDRVFGNCPNAQSRSPKLTIAMGSIAVVTDSMLEHDANTMGNSSGSPLIRISDGALVGVHSGDAMSSIHNTAIPAGALATMMVAAAP